MCPALLTDVRIELDTCKPEPANVSHLCRLSDAHPLSLCADDWCCLMQVAELDGCPRMGPTFGAMMASGRKAAHVALNSLRRQKAAALDSVPPKEAAAPLKELVNA